MFHNNQFNWDGQKRVGACELVFRLFIKFYSGKWASSLRVQEEYYSLYWAFDLDTEHVGSISMET